MIEFFGYNFLSDGNAVDPYPTNVKESNYVKIQNAIFDSVEITQDVTSPYITEIPTERSLYDILFANFKGNLDASNIETMLEQITSIRVKRRKYGTFDWTTIYEQDIRGQVGDLSFIFNDYFAKSNEVYEYAWIPMMNDVEGEYIIKNVLSRFSGVFVADMDSIYKFEANVGFDGMQQVQKIGVFEPFGRQYPVYVSNALTNYKIGNFQATLVGDYTNTGRLNRQEMVEERENLLKFLTNKKAKVIKDYNGNFWIVVVIENPSVTFDQNWGNGITSVNFQWSEVGNEDDINMFQPIDITR